jgi:hypothetical protein
MIKLTFAFDCQLNENEDYVKEGQEVELYSHPRTPFNPDFVPVRITEAFSLLGGKIKTDEVVWFKNSSFKEYQK